jgi:hypothetical protein
MAAQSMFFADDLLYGSILTTEPLTSHLLLRSWFGHLGPGFIAVDWTFFRVFGANWAAAAAVIVAIQLAGTTALIRLLHAVRGRSWVNLGVAAFAVLSLAVTTQSLWWGAVLSNLLPLAASIATLGCFARWVRTRRARHLVAMALVFAVAVSFYEKSVLTAGYVALLSVLVLDAGVPWRRRWRTTLDRWPAWLLLALIAGTDLAIYLSGDYMLEAGPAPGKRDLVTFLLFSLPEGLVPGLFGFRPAALPAGFGVAILLVTNAVMLGVVVWSSIRSSRALQAWVFFAVGYLLNQGILGRGRVSMLGVHMGTLLRYQLENVILCAVALAVALPALAPVVRRRIPALRPGRRSTAAVVAGLVAVVAVQWWGSVRAEVDVAPGVATRSYVQNLRSSYDALQHSSPDVAFLPGDVVPNWLVYGAMAPYNRFDRVFPLLLPTARFTGDADRVLTVSDEGVARPSDFIAAADVPTAGACLTGGTPAAAWVARLARPLADGQWVIRLGFRAASDGTVTVTVDNDAPGADLRMAIEPHAVTAGSTGLVAVAGSLPVHKLSIQFDGPGPLCLDSLRLGTFKPE